MPTVNVHRPPETYSAVQWTGYYNDATRESNLGNLQEIIHLLSPRGCKVYIEYDPSGEFCLVLDNATSSSTKYVSYGAWIVFSKLNGRIQDVLSEESFNMAYVVETEDAAEEAERS